MQKKIMLLGSGELGKELVISLKRLGQTVIAVDSYADAPAQQVADFSEVINMLDGAELDRLVEKYRPSIIIPEIEAIRTERFYDYEKQGIRVVPSAKAANTTMNRKAIRDLAGETLKLKTAKYVYASTLVEFTAAVHRIGMPCVVKPLMSSSGKGQSIVRSESDINKSWDYAMSGTRGDVMEVIVEEFIRFESEITLLTVTCDDGSVFFCPPIGHRQEDGDYRESWQPHIMKEEYLHEAQKMAAAVTKELGGSGIWGVEFFLAENGVYFSELSPRPHDTGMVTLAGTQNLSEFELHARAVLGLPIHEIILERYGASAVILANGDGQPNIQGIDKALRYDKSDIRIFGKPVKRFNRRMGVALCYDAIGSDINKLVSKAREVASQVKV